ncbi:hypothetical protein OHB26_36570 [Nocardia sp. NBC_01503]|uniref:hypothetical protein n=1 Tax=Nocardia sp. NBC_01503 TaxID=2975997 RepID=UPI002E7AF6F3|nr:hypothetical protein [Nocardia sp. NBC_01503]WTL32320.1 hypothetical protein OHB26_36570 [Nocardia sp. NBC_01503]
MKNGAAVRLYLRIFLLTGIPFGVVIGLYDSITFAGGTAAILGGVVTGAIFGALSAGFGGTGQLRAARAAVYTDATDLRLPQSARIRVERPAPQAYALAQQVLRALPARITAEDAVLGRITAQTGITWQSFGENIAIAIESDGADAAEVLVEGRPRLRFTAVDYGLGRQRVERIAANLTDLAARGRARPR